MRSLNRLIVVDIEATCWESGAPSQQNEIIEIGICPIDLISLTPEKASSILVRPVFSTVSEFCTKLTSLTQEEVDKGISFKAACNLLRNHHKTPNMTWGSWGNYDRKQLEKQCRNIAFGARYPFGPTHLNIKNLFALHTGLKKEVGMDRALELIGIELEGVHHRGIDDARNIAKILCYLLKGCHNILKSFTTSSQVV